MKTSVKNEYGNLKSVILGRPEGANWPNGDSYFDRYIKLNTHKGKIKRGPLSKDAIEKMHDDMLYMADILKDHEVAVFRPQIKDYAQTVTHYGNVTTGMNSYSVKDTLLSVGDMVIECPTPFASQYRTFESYDVIKQEAIRDGSRWIAAPRTRMEPAEAVHKEAKLVLTERYPIFTGTNILKFDDKLLYFKSSTANQTGADWLQKIVGTDFEVIVWDKAKGVNHLNNLIVPLKSDMILINADRVSGANLPAFLKSYRKIWLEDRDCIEKTFDNFPYASKWVGLGALVVNEDTVMIDPIQQTLKKLLETEFKILPIALTESRTFGGGHHSVTCDLERE